MKLKTQIGILLLLILSLFSGVEIAAQSYNAIQNYFDNEDGLLHREVNAIIEDDDGFMWFGTRQGLNRFDGHDFESYTVEENGLLTNHIGNFVKDGNQNLWLIPFNYKGGNITLFNYRTKIVNSLDERYGNSLSFPSFDIGGKILSNSNKEILIGCRSRGALAKIHSDGSVSEYSFPYKSLVLAAYTQDDCIWAIADKNKLVKVSNNGIVLKEVLSKSDILLLNFYCDLESKPYFRTQDRTELTINESDEIVKVQIGKFPIPVYIESNYMGIFPLDEKDKTYWYFTQDLESNKAHDRVMLIDSLGNVLFEMNDLFGKFHERGLRSHFVDSRKRTWFGSNYGVTVVNVRPNRFSTFLSDSLRGSTVLGNSCRGLEEDGDFLYVNLESKGLFRIQIETGRKEQLLPIDGSDMFWSMALEKDDFGNLWIGSEFSIVKRNLETGKMDFLPFGSREENTIVWSLWSDSKGFLWIGTESGLWFIEPGQLLVQKYTFLNEFRELDESHVLHIGADNQGNILACTNKGIYEIDANKGVQQHYWTGAESKHGLPHDYIQHFYQDEEGVFWLSSGGGGLIRWEKELGKSKQFGKAEGMSNNVVYASYPDKHNNLWVSSDFGIVRFDKNTFQTSVFLPSNGISHWEFNRISHLFSEKGDIYFGSLNGVTKIVPDRFLDYKDEPQFPLKITSFQQFDGSTEKLVDKTLELITESSIIVRPTDRFFQIDFAQLNYLNPERVNYAYKIGEGEWIHQKENNIKISGLTYGSHLLKMKGQSPNGEWSEEIWIDVKVLKPFYLKTWFIVLAGLILLGTGPLLYILKIRRLRKRQIKLEAIVQERTLEIQRDKLVIEQQANELRQLDELKSQFFANVSHELRTPLTLMLGPIGSLLKGDKIAPNYQRILKIAQKSGKNLLNLVNEILDLSKLESGKLDVNTNPVNIFSLVSRLFAQFESFGASRGIDMTQNISIPSDQWILLDADKFEIIYNNLLSNALKYTSNGQSILVRIKEENGFLELNVKDTGQGIHHEDVPFVFDRFYQSKHSGDQAKGGTGIGLAICREYANLQDGSIVVESRIGEGTVFTLKLPFIQTKASKTNFPSEETSIKDLQEIKFIQKEVKEVTSTTDKVLIVEDNSELREYIKLILQNDYSLYTASNGLEALELLTGSKLEEGQAPVKIDLILSDVMMPVMDGFEFLNEIKQDEKFSQIPVVMLTARAGIQDKLKALRIGVDDYMLKPFEEEELTARIENLLKNYKSREPIKADQTQDSTNPSLNLEDLNWLETLEDFAKINSRNFNFTADQMAQEMAISRSQFFRKLKQLTGLTPNQYVQEIRFNKARVLLENKTYSTVKAVSYEVGFKQVKHFSQQFKKRFGKLPSAYLK